LTPVVEVEIVEARGSAPREAGTRMWVGKEAIRGTIGGGNLEYTATGIAREMLASGEALRERRFALGDSLGQCCGGSVRLRFALREGFPPEDTPAFEVVLFGAGHVGKELARILERLPCRLTWADGRPEIFPREVGANVRVVLDDEPAWVVQDAAPGSYFLVMTHSHALDLALVEAILRRGDFAYLGLIGSQTKAAKFKARLRRRGLREEQLERLTSPIGLFKSGKHPAAVAVSAVAQLLEIVARHDARPASTLQRTSEVAGAPLK
jgi:xanthine dehydrogenase accessory factor